MSQKTEDINKAIDQFVDQELEKSMPTTLDENGGKDKIKSGTPFTEKGEGKPTKSQGSMYGEGSAKKSEDQSEEDENAMDKANYDEEQGEKRGEQDTGPDEYDEKSMKKKKKMEKKYHKSEAASEEEDSESSISKAMEELGELSEDEIELVKAWREENAEDESDEEVEKSQPVEQVDFNEALSKSLKESLEPMQKAFEEKLEERDNIIKSLSEKLDNLEKQPAYDKRSLSNLEAIEKGGDQKESTLSKSDVLDKLLDLQKSGKGVTSHDIAQFEGTGNVRPEVRRLIDKEFSN